MVIWIEPEISQADEGEPGQADGRAGAQFIEHFIHEAAALVVTGCEPLEFGPLKVISL